MSGNGIFRECEAEGLSASAGLLLLFLRDEAVCNTDLRVVGGREWLAERLGFSVKVIRNSLAALRAAGKIEFDPPKGKDKALLIAISAFREKGQLKGQLISSIIPPDSVGVGQLKGHTGVAVSSVVSLSGVVVDGGLDVNKTTSAAKTTAAAEPSLESQKQEKKAPGYVQLCAHIVETWKAKKHGVPPKWSKEAWVNLHRQTTRFSCPEIAALWDAYLADSDPFVVSQAYSLNWFASRRIDVLMDDQGYKRRAEKYAALWLGLQPFDRSKTATIVESPAVYSRAQYTTASSQAPVSAKPSRRYMAPALPDEKDITLDPGEKGLLERFKDEMLKSRESRFAVAGAMALNSGL